MFQRFSRMHGGDRPRRILEWGVGGGTNAVQFAPLCDEFIAVDVVQESLDETARQVALTSGASVTSLLVSVTDQTAAVTNRGGTIDLFLCFYVLELVPSRAHAEEIVRTAYELLRPGGAAILQIKYARSAPRRMPWTAAGADLANHYTVDIVEFWTHLTAVGFDVHYVEIVPRDPVDRNYAYFLATRR